MGGIAANGWRFWSLQGTEAPKPKVEKPGKAKKEPAAKAGGDDREEERQGQDRQEAEGGTRGEQGRRFVRLRRLRRDVPGDEGGDGARAHAHQQLTSLLATAAGSTRSLLSLYDIAPRLPRAVEWGEVQRIELRWIDDLLEGEEGSWCGDVTAHDGWMVRTQRRPAYRATGQHVAISKLDAPQRG